ncbi:hypothetical protein BC939DRAFT_498717 [Gamsiella multidivaricata]|uniref:uncharacterized protein n=1 Tax=Gamsiella multidivaricata TaxID=101098 RepID=UPI00221FA399|nr:uncharacterized protein BC939DRAFT_498717 [Gamsiella multidivaricata]KAG0365582.1 hypothetical protein BGZ54_006393 [Gamsiella multidivaricata]KAI7831746.1 hypothetical protein BC939DRAFT_498717 [Gamsiella multidivaricata]
MAMDSGIHDSEDSEFDLKSLRIRKIFTLIFIHDKEHQQLLLGQKQRGALLGQWNGFGGKVEQGLESIIESAARELQEEAFLTASLFPIGFIQWVVSSSEETTYRDVMVVFKAHSINTITQPLSESGSSGASSSIEQETSKPRRITEFKASDEMAPAWWDIDRLPWEDMRINHKVWYPFMLADLPYRGVYWYEMTRISAAESAENAQRENAQEIWVEDLDKRRFEFGVQSISKNAESDDLKFYADCLGIQGTCYTTTVVGRQEKQSSNAKVDPMLSRLLDENWLKTAIAKAEQEWITM